MLAFVLQPHITIVDRGIGGIDTTGFLAGAGCGMTVSCLPRNGFAKRFFHFLKVSRGIGRLVVVFHFYNRAAAIPFIRMSSRLVLKK